MKYIARLQIEKLDPVTQRRIFAEVYHKFEMDVQPDQIYFEAYHYLKWLVYNRKETLRPGRNGEDCYLNVIKITEDVPEEDDGLPPVNVRVYFGLMPHEYSICIFCKKSRFNENGELTEQAIHSIKKLLYYKHRKELRPDSFLIYSSYELTKEKIVEYI